MRTLIGFLLAVTVIVDGLILMVLTWAVLSAQVQMSGGDWLFLLILAVAGVLAVRQLRALWRYEEPGALAWIAILGGLVLPPLVLYLAAVTCCVFV